MTALRSPWLRHGVWNTMEHALIRIGDALVTLLIIRALPVETFSSLALAQAWVAPCLLFFIAPETVLYRDYTAWKSEGPARLAARVRHLRRFSWLKGALALALSALLASLLPLAASWTDRFLALTWAFWLPATAHVSGADREFLRLSLRLKELNGVGLFHKAYMIGGSLAALALTPSGRSPVAALAAVSLSCGLATSWLARRQAERVLVELRAEDRAERAPGERSPTFGEVLHQSIGTFSLWQHLVGVVQNWIQTMDLLLLGIVGAPARELGLYAVALKLANLSNALPSALGNLFSLWLGRLGADRDRPRELSHLRRMTALLIGATTFQGAVLYLISPWLLELLLRSGSQPVELAMVQSWLGWILLGTVAYNASLLLGAWLAVRSSMSTLFLQVHLPWTVFALAAFTAGAWLAGPPGAAMANVPVNAMVGCLLAVYFARNCRKKVPIVAGSAQPG